jgi:hypothetical protein
MKKKFPENYIPFGDGIALYLDRSYNGFPLAAYMQRL